MSPRHRRDPEPRAKEEIQLELPYPPSVNAYWRRVGNRTVLSKAARAFRKQVADLWFAQRYIFGREGFHDQWVAVELVAHPPDDRRRDLDNFLKAVFDALEHAGVIEDDSQIRKIQACFGPAVDQGKVIVSLKRIDANR